MTPTIEKLITRVVESFAGNIHQELQQNKTIVVGASDGPLLLAGEIAKTGSPVTIIDSDPSGNRVVPYLSATEVIQGDPTDVEILKKARTEHATVLVAATLSDEVNLAVCRTAEMTFDPIRLIALVNDQANIADFEVLGYEVMSLARAALTLLKKPELSAELRELFKERDADEILTEISVNSPVVLGRKLSSILIGDCDLLELRRWGKSVLIDDSTTLQIGDSITLFGNVRAVEAASHQLNPQC